MPTKEDAIDVMKEIFDPELSLDIWTLGLIYDIEVTAPSNIHVRMTFTSPTCPYAPQIVEQVRQGLEDAGFQSPELEFVFDPPWEPTEEVKMMLGLA